MARFLLATTPHKRQPLSLCILGGHLQEVRLYVHGFFVCGFLVFAFSSLFLSLEFMKFDILAIFCSPVFANFLKVFFAILLS